MSVARRAAAVLAWTHVALACAALACAAFAVIALGARPAEALPPLPPELELGAYRFAADVDDATAILLNPAAMAGAVGTDLFMDVSGGHRFPDEWTGGLQGGWAGVAYRHHQGKNCVPCGGIMTAATIAGPTDWHTDGYVLAAAQGPRWLSVGVAGEWLDTSEDAVEYGAWNLSVLSRPSPRVSAALVVERVGPVRYGAITLPRRFTYGVSLRPLSSSARRLTVSVQGRHEAESGGRVDMLYGIGLTSRSGYAAALTVRDLNGAPPELGISVTRFVRNGSYTGRLRTSKRGSDTARGSLSVQAFDEFWRRTHAPGASGALISAGPRSR